MKNKFDDLVMSKTLKRFELYLVCALAVVAAIGFSSSSPAAPAQKSYVKASNTGPGDLFAASVAVSGDTMVIGATHEASNASIVNGNQNDNSAPASGAAYVLVRNGTNWVQQAYLTASSSVASHRDRRKSLSVDNRNRRTLKRNESSGSCIFHTPPGINQ
jgi:hypothetical protein